MDIKKKETQKFIELWKFAVVQNFVISVTQNHSAETMAVISGFPRGRVSSFLSPQI